VIFCEDFIKLKAFINVMPCISSKILIIRGSLYGKVRKMFGAIVRDLCKQKGVEILEGHAMSDHVYVCLRCILCTFTRLK
ncbi:MAG: hypothetical protein GY714_10850, partial [Desulfobacterales bacterium]|nr:hypothetical protein [Desulfobacterales bacterium]